MRASATSSRHIPLTLFAVALAFGLLPLPGAQPAAMADETDGVVAIEDSEPLADQLSSEADGAVPGGLEEAGEAPAEAEAEEASDDAAGRVPLVAASQLSREAALQPLSEDGLGAPLLADALVGKPTRFINQEVPLDGSASVLGSFTVDGMTYAVTGEGTVEFVAVAPIVLAGSLAAASDPVVLDVPESVEYDGAAYSVSSVGPRAFAGCAADVASLPATVEVVDEAAFRGSLVGAVEVEEGSPYLASYEGVLYDADFSDLLLIPEGKKGAVRIHPKASAITPGAFSHCASVTSVEVDAGNESFCVEDGVLSAIDGGEALLDVDERGAKGEDEASIDQISCGEVFSSDSPQGRATDGKNSLTLEAGGGWIMVSTHKNMADPSFSKPTYALNCDCPNMSVRVCPDTINVLDFRHGSANATHTYAVFVRPGYKVKALELYNAEDTIVTRTDTLTTTYDTALKNKGGTVRAVWEPITLTCQAQAEGFWYKNNATGEREEFLNLTINSLIGSDSTTAAIEKNGYSLVTDDDAIPIYVTRWERWDVPDQMWIPTADSDNKGLVIDLWGAALCNGGTVFKNNLESSHRKRTITWDPQNGDALLTTLQPTTGTTTLTLPNEPTLEGCTFDGWWDSSDGGTRISSTTAIPNTDTTYYAHWRGNAYTIGFNPNNGSGGQSKNVTATFGSAMPTISATAPTRTGYAFQGWYDNADYTKGTQYYTAEGKSARRWDKTQATTLYAGWKAKTYTATFDKQGGKGGTDSTKVTYGEQWGPIEIPARSGYKFLGYWFSTTATTVPYWGESGEKRRGETTWNLAYDHTFYARWEPLSYKIAYDLGGGTLEGAQTSYTIETEQFSVGTPEREGYSFGGWSLSWPDDPGHEGYPSWDGIVRKGTTGNLKAVAKWKANTYAVEFKANGGKGGQSAKVTATYDADMPEISTTAPTREGYSFTGWYDNADHAKGAQYYTAEGKSARKWQRTSGVTLYAGWKAQTYAVKFDVNGGKGGQSKDVSATYDADMPEISKTAPTRTGYAFGGWYDTSSSTGGTQYYTAEGKSARPWDKASNTTLYARWTANTYNVRYFTKDGTHIGTDTKDYDAWFNLRGDPGRTHQAYTAKGWARSANQTSASHTFALWTRNLASAQGANFDLYVAEIANEYTISYDLADGSLSEQPTSYTFETADFQLPEPSRAGYEFLGWKVTGAAEASAGIESSGTSTTVKQGTWGNLSCVATWRANEYTVALDAAFPEFATGVTYESYAPYGVSKDAGTASVTATFDAGMPAATMPSATGYTFEGYFDDAGTQYYDADGSSARTWDKPGDVTLHGRWALERHELTLDVGNGEVPSAASRGWTRDEGAAGLYRLSYSIEYVEESGGSLRIQLPAPATKPGYSVFDGWTGPNLSKPSKSVQVQPWELADRDYVGAFSGASTYVASLDLAGGSFDPAPDGWGEAGDAWSRSFTVESEAFDLPTPVRAGHDFQGWALVGADGSLGSPAVSVTVPKGTVGDCSYRAVWQARTYTITWDYAGQVIDGATSATSSQVYGHAIAFPSRPSEADSAREHFEFTGWFTAAEGGEKVEPGDYLIESDSTFYARWELTEYVIHLHLGDDDAYAEREASIEQDGQALPLAPDGHYDMAYTVEDEVKLPTVTDDPATPKPVREGMSFVGWVECAEDGSFDPDLVPSMEVVLPAGTYGEHHFRAVWFFALRFEVPSVVGFRLDLADDAAFEDAPHGPVRRVEGEGVEMRSLSLGQLAVVDVAVDVEGADPAAIVTDRSKVQLRVMDASLPEPWTGWIPLPITSAPERVDPYDLAGLGFGDGNALGSLASKPLRYEIEVQDPVTTLAGEVTNLPLAKVVFTVKGLW